MNWITKPIPYLGTATHTITNADWDRSSNPRSKQLCEAMKSEAFRRIIDSIVRQPIFSWLTPEDFISLIDGDYIQILEIKKGAQIIKEGDTDTSFYYIILNGKLAVEKNGNHICDIGAWEPIGHYWYYWQEPRSATVVAASDSCVMARLSHENLPERLDKIITRNMLRTSIQELQKNQAHTKALEWMIHTLQGQLGETQDISMDQLMSTNTKRACSQLVQVATL